MSYNDEKGNIYSKKGLAAEQLVFWIASSYCVFLAMMERNELFYLFIFQIAALISQAHNDKEKNIYSELEKKLKLTIMKDQISAAPFPMAHNDEKTDFCRDLFAIIKKSFLFDFLMRFWVL
ncbi:MAG: hypothetical protein LBP54_02480 [Campylobacteraceae bacterium]|jgi:hypothetical protein|nr:hypothetical protein [Campylobacteraceae bacterium]